MPINSLRKMSFWSAVIGFCFFVADHYCAALAIRFITECLRLPYFVKTRLRDQIALCVFIMSGCVYGLGRQLDLWG